MTTPLPRRSWLLWLSLSAFALAIVLLLASTQQKKTAPKGLSDAEAIRICESYNPIGGTDRDRVMKMFRICNQALESFKKKDLK